MNRPRPAYARPRRISPAIRPTTRTPSAPYRAMIGTSTTVIAPVGPLTWTRLPPKTAARAPATIAVVSPAAAPMPELGPQPSARPEARCEGQRHQPDHDSGHQVTADGDVGPVRAPRQQPQHPGGHTVP